MSCKGAVFLLSRGQREHPGGGAGTAADLAHGGGDIAGSLDAFERRGHICQKTFKTLVLGRFPITSGVRRRGGPVRASPRSGLGITWITERSMQQIN